MSNMSYCRFENTYSDLQDCAQAIEDAAMTPEEDETSEREKMYRKKLIGLCQTIAEAASEFEDE